MKVTQTRLHDKHAIRFEISEIVLHGMERANDLCMQKGERAIFPPQESLSALLLKLAWAVAHEEEREGRMQQIREPE